MRAMRIGVLLLAIAIGSPAWGEKSTPSEIDVLRERAVAYWAAKTSGAPVEPFYENGIVREGLGLKIERATVGRIEVSDTTALVDVDLRVGVFTFKTSPQMAQLLNSDQVRNRQIRDYWIRVDGTWYRKPPDAKWDDDEAAPATPQDSGGEVASDHSTASK